jgi:adenosine deaminase CECR1
MPTYFHAGETNNRHSVNLHDSILLGTKRIGHGFQLQCFPHLQELCKQKDICLEVCPLSNVILGYNQDIRNHPINVLLAKGVQVCINSDDPTFFGYDGVTLDWTYATGGW